MDEKAKIIFFGNGMLADAALEVLKQHFEIVFHAKTKEDLVNVAKLKRENPNLHGILASFGVIIRRDLLELFEPEGILNIHPSLLPLYRGASPIESAILNGDSDFGVSIMKLAPAMDAGPIYHQEILQGLPLEKSVIYAALASAGAEWLVANLLSLPEPTPQDDKKATFTAKLTKEMSYLTPKTDTAEVTLRKIVAYQGYPKPKYAFYGQNCIILAAHIQNPNEMGDLVLPCLSGALVIDKLQPEGRKPMDAKAFLNGYKRV